MENTNEEIYFNFSYYALNLLGKQMYSNKWSAISELVANGIDAGADIVRVYINSKNQKESIMEIFDDGSGMDYNDLANKYAYIGRNKREETGGNNLFMGRKGVGKLAALFLSKKYYILSKTEGYETAWILDSSQAKDSDMPRLERIDPKSIKLDNQTIWDSYTKGTMIKLVDVDFTNFASKRLLSLKQRIANFYLLDKISSRIEVAHVDTEHENKQFNEVEKEIAFRNFYGVFESEKELVKPKLSEIVKIRDTKFEKVNPKRSVKVYSPNEIKNSFSIVGEKEYLNTQGEKETIPYKLEGWIGIHASIQASVAVENDKTFLRNNVYNPNKLRLYVRNKLAVENLLDVVNNSQTFINYIEGEISFDILDDDRLPDISTTNREGMTDSDGRVTLLKGLVNPIINRLITERIKIGQVITEEEDAITIQREKELEEKRRQEEEARKREEQERKRAEEEKYRAEKKATELSIQKNKLEEDNETLSTQNKLKDVLLSESDPKRQDLLTHELTLVRQLVDTTVDRMTEEFRKNNEYDRISGFVKDLKKSSIKLNVIRKQFLRLNDYELMAAKTININSFLNGYLDTLPLVIKRILKRNINDEPFYKIVDVFDFGVLLDNIFQNARDHNASRIEIKSDGLSEQIVITSDTGPIKINPPEKIFELGVTSKEEGTGVGMYLVKEIAHERNWEVLVENYLDDVSIIIDLRKGL